MRITRVEVKNYRSLFGEDQKPAFCFDVAAGVNTLVGPNNCGKSNVLRAMSLALDPAQVLDRDRDMPAHYFFAVPWITLTLQCDRKVSVERTLLRYAEDYERSLKGATGSTFAEDGVVRLAVSFPGNDLSGARRVEQIQARGKGALRGDPEKLDKALTQLRKSYRFVLVESGQSLEELLTGKFREILHTVIREHRGDDFDAADRRRSGYVETLQDTLLDPLRCGIQAIVGDLFPEITGVSLLPRVPSIDETLSEVAVHLRDGTDSALANKGTGVRGGVTVAMLRYLADHGKRSMIFAVEEPEAFLHPGAQEDLRDELEGLAARPDVTLLVSTHSPFVVSRRSDAQVVALSKSAEGRTFMAGCARGDETKASLLGGLFRDAALADILDRSAFVPSEAKAVLITEGEGDLVSLRLAAARAGRADLLDGLHLSAAGGAIKAVAQALVTKSQTAKPIMVLLDSDEPGRKAREMLSDRFRFQNKKEVTSYGELFANETGIEAEDLWPSSLLEQFVTERGEAQVLTGKHKRNDGDWHYDISAAAKDELGGFLEANVAPADCERWVSLLETIRQRLAA